MFQKQSAPAGWLRENSEEFLACVARRTALGRQRRHPVLAEEAGPREFGGENGVEDEDHGLGRAEHVQLVVLLLAGEFQPQEAFPVVSATP